MTDEAERRWREDPSDPFEDLRQRLMQVERDQGELLHEIQAVRERLNRIGLLIERDTRERRWLGAVLVVLLVVPWGLWAAWFWI